jgi:Na+/H+-dicarboxylate symporter
MGFQIDADFLLSFFIASFVVSLSVPGIPCSEVIALAAVFNLVGIPAETSALFFPLNPIAGIFIVGSNVMGNIVSSFLLARLEDKVDETVYMEG